MWVSKFFVFFILFSMFGWVFESIHAVIKLGKWENRGFLYGPICPIYGVGASTVTAIRLVFDVNGISIPPWWVTFLVCFFGSIVLEYGTHYALEKMFHAYWWDYSDIPLNLNGRVCLPASVAFGIAGALIMNMLAPTVLEIMGKASPELSEVCALLCMAVAAADVTVTVCALTDFARRVDAISTMANQKMENLVEEKGRIYNNGIEAARKSMGVVYRSALSRIEGVRPDLKRYPQRTYEVMMKLIGRGGKD